MSNFHDMLYSRRSCRKFASEPLDPDSVKEIAEAALLAPTSMNRKPCQFTLVEDKTMLEQLSHCKVQGANPIAGCALAIVVSSNPSESDVWIEDAAIAASYIQLQVESLGLGSCWIQIRNRMHSTETTASEQVKELLNMDGAQQVVAIVAIGNKGETLTSHKEQELDWGKIHVEKWED